MRMVIVPNSLSNEIYRRIDAALVEVPEAADGRDEFYDALLAHFDEHGVIPDFTLQKRTHSEHDQ